MDQTQPIQTQPIAELSPTTSSPDRFADAGGSRSFQLAILALIAGLTALLFRLSENPLAVLNLFFLPVVLTACFLGQQRAGVVALIAVLAVVATTTQTLPYSAIILSPQVVGLTVMLWSAVLGLTALLVGSLSDERSRTIEALHEAHLGVVEILSRYLQRANPRLSARSHRVADLTVRVARRLQLSAAEVDNIRIACLLRDMEHIEITARAVRSRIAASSPEEDHEFDQHTFQGTEFADAIGQKLGDAYDLLLSQKTSGGLTPLPKSVENNPRQNLSADILRAVRAFDTLATDSMVAPEDVIDTLASDLEHRHSAVVLEALRTEVLQSPRHQVTPERPLRARETAPPQSASPA